MRKIYLALVTASSVLLTACGGGGGGGGGGPSYLYYDPTTTSFPNARLTAPVNTVVATGQLLDSTPVSASYQGFSSATLNVSLD